MKITKSLVWLLMFTLTIGIVSGAVVTNMLSKQEFANNYPNDPFVKRAQDCGGLSDTACLMSGAMQITCKVVAETEHDGSQYIKFECLD